MDAQTSCTREPTFDQGTIKRYGRLGQETRKEPQPGKAAMAASPASSSVWCCLRWGCCEEGGGGHIPLKEMPSVLLDTQRMGTDVVIVKNGRRVCGTGGCLANAPLHQNKSYFEFKIQSTGIWGIGVATQKVNLNQIPLGCDGHSLVLRNDGALYYNNEEKNRLAANNLPQEGDVVGITYDHVELNIYLNGKNMHCPASGIRGTVFPVVYVDDSAILDCQFSDFYHTPPSGFEKILFEQQIF
uniref:SPRY domain-containing protein 7 n=1 Tax=Pogona vitticeps TaxID=103695 RepID=A0A6J0U293_9SAUR